MKRFVGILLAAGSAAALAGMAHAQPSWGGPRAILFEQPNFQGRSTTIVEGSPNLGDGSFAARAMSARFDGDWTVCDAPDLDGHCVTVRGYVADLAQLGLRRIASMGGNDAPDDARSDSHPEAAAATTNADAPSERAVSEAAADDEQVPGARVGARYGSFDAPPPAPPTAAAQPVGPAPSVMAQAAEPPPPSAAFAAPAVQGAPTGPGTMQQVAFANPSAAGPPVSGVAQAVQSDAGPAAVFFAKPMHGAAEVPIDAQGPANQFCHDQGLGPAVYYDTDGHVLHDIVCRRP